MQLYAALSTAFSNVQSLCPSNFTILPTPPNTASTAIAYTQLNEDRKSKGEELDTASAVIYTYRSISRVVALKMPSGSLAN